MEVSIIAVSRFSLANLKGYPSIQELACSVSTMRDYELFLCEQPGILKLVFSGPTQPTRAMNPNCFIKHKRKPSESLHGDRFFSGGNVHS